jgi:aminomethyltransferase
MSSQPLKKTLLYDTHVGLGARMVPFAGFEMPVQYSGPLEEHQTVRSSAGLFDIDHMGQIIVEGPDAADFLQYVVTSDIGELQEWEAHYSLLCYADGTTVDDIFIYRLPEYWWVVVNASNLDKDFKWLKAHSAGFDVTLKNVSEETYMLAFQGPKAQEVLQRITDINLGEIAFHWSARGKVAGIDALIGNTGYTGEYGYELFFPAYESVTMWNAILDAGRAEGVKPIGLAARDSLRFEPCLPLYGHELSPSITPLEAGLGFAVKTDKGDFVGRDALLKQRLEGPERKLVCLQMEDKGVPRENYEVQKEGVTIGFVTAGMMAPTVECYAAMALIPKAEARVGNELDVVIHGKPRKAKIVPRPFYVPAYRR